MHFIDPEIVPHGPSPLQSRERVRKHPHSPPHQLTPFPNLCRPRVPQLSSHLPLRGRPYFKKSTDYLFTNNKVYTAINVENGDINYLHKIILFYLGCQSPNYENLKGHHQALTAYSCWSFDFKISTVLYFTTFLPQSLYVI